MTKFHFNEYACCTSYWPLFRTLFSVSVIKCMITSIKLPLVQGYHIFSNSRHVYLDKNHYENWSPQLVPTDPPGWPSKWTPCPGGLRRCWTIMVVTQNIDTLGPVWTFSRRGVLTYVASNLDINGCIFSYFEHTINLSCYKICRLTTLHCVKVSFPQCCPMKRYK